MPHTPANYEPRVTKKVYACFKSECKELSKFIEAVTDEEEKQRRASVLLIRLMFVYFVQSKGLPCGDTNILFSRFDMENPRSQVPDAAFKRVFDFFDQYRWRLEEDVPRDDSSITPDVLGHILEQHINQKQMAAYYTKDDITEYIAKNT